MIVRAYRVPSAHGEFYIQMPRDAQVLDIQFEQGDEKYSTPMLWAASSSTLLARHGFLVVFTDEEYKEGWRHIKTLQLHGIGLHYFQYP